MCVCVLYPFHAPFPGPLVGGGGGRSSAVDVDETTDGRQRPAPCGTVPLPCTERTLTILILEHVLSSSRRSRLGECFDIDSIANDMDRKFLSRCFPQSTVCILYSLQSKAIRTGSVPGTTTFSSQSATILVASLLLYIVFLDF